jgi:Domain of unknown function (DUF4124)
MLFLRVSVLVVSALTVCSALAQGIYTCVDEKGRKITSDRPIAECMDRAQKELNPSGTVRRVVTPPPTSKDRAAMEEKEKQEADARSKAAEEKLRDRALLTRYPDRASHDKERTMALEQATTLSAAAAKRSQELAEQRKGIVGELDFYKSSPGKVPPALKRRLDETDANIATQKRVATEQDAEKKRINARFDEEQAKLKPQWDVAGAAKAPVSAKKP